MTLIGDTIRIMKASFEVGYYSCQKGIPLDVALEDFVVKMLPPSTSDDYTPTPRERNNSDKGYGTVQARNPFLFGGHNYTPVKGTCSEPTEKPWWKFW